MSDINVTIGQNSVAVAVGAAKGLAGDDGREIEIQNSGTYIQWRYVGDVSWTNLVALSTITGATGATGIVVKGVYDSLTDYVPNDAVTHNGSFYICILASSGNNPSNVTYWTKYVSKGDTGATGGVNSVNTLQGDVTLTTANVTDSLNKRYVTDANLTVIGNTSGTNTGDQDLSGLEPTITGGLISQYWSGIKTWRDFATDVLSSLTNTAFGTLISGYTAKTTPVDADGVVISDSDDTGKAKYLSLSNLDTYIKAKLSAAGYITLATDTLANLITNYPPANYSGCSANATDIAINTVRMTSNGTAWTPLNGVAILTRLELPVGKAPTFTGTTNGAITFGTAVGVYYPKCFVYYPANSIVAGQAAGFLYTEMINATQAVVYNNAYTPAAGTYPTEPPVKIAFSGAVPGGTGSISQITSFIFTIRGKLLGLSGGILSYVSFDHNANANAKYIRLVVGGTGSQLHILPSAATSLTGQGAASFRNTGSTNIQRADYVYNYASTGSNSVQTTIDTLNDFTLAVTIQTTTATDFIMLTRFLAEMEIA